MKQEEDGRGGWTNSSSNVAFVCALRRGLKSTEGEGNMGFRRIGLLASLIAVLLSAGCSATSTSSQSRPETTDQRYLRVAHQQSSFKNSSDQTLLDFGHSICGLFDAGNDESRVTIELLKNQTPNQTPDDLGAVEADAVVSFCSKYLYQFQSVPTDSPSPQVSTPESAASSPDVMASPADSLAPGQSESAAPPVGATAMCNDGTYSYAAHHQGACSHHGGVAIFYH